MFRASASKLPLNSQMLKRAAVLAAVASGGSVYCYNKCNSLSDEDTKDTVSQTFPTTVRNGFNKYHQSLLNTLQNTSLSIQARANRTLCEFGMIGVPVKEPKTGLLFPTLCNGMTFVGCGVRVKYGFVKVYAVGTYVDPVAYMGVKSMPDEHIEKALVDPHYPRCIRIVMNRNLSVEKFTAAIIEALEPRMNNEDLDKLEEFKAMNPPVELCQGAEMTMTIRGDTLLYKNSAGSVGAIHSIVFTRAFCDTFYGKDAVSPPHKEDVIKGIKAL